MTCTCGHDAAEHSRGKGRCAGLDSYECLCTCPSFDPDPDDDVDPFDLELDQLDTTVATDRAFARQFGRPDNYEGAHRG